MMQTLAPWMDALEALAGAVWRPWLAVVVLALGLVVTLVTLFVQLRALPRGIAGLVGKDGASDVRHRGLAMLAASCGVGSLAAGAFAVAIGGRGALVWLWLVTVLGMAVRFGEAIVRTTPKERRATPGPIVRASTMAWTVGAGVCAIAIGGLWQANQTAGLLEVGWGIPPTLGALVLATVAAPFVLVPSARRPLFAAVPIAFAVLVAATAIAIGQDGLVLSLAVGDAWNEALGLRPAISGALGGTAAIAMVEGVLRGTISGMAGIGAVRPAGPPPRVAAVAMIATLAGGLAATLGALVIMTSSSEPVPIVEGDLTPLERAHSRGLRPSQQVGQTMVLPLDSPLQDGEHYALRLRSNPRGVPLGRLDSEQNAVYLPNWEVAQNADTIVFRTRDKEKQKLAAWDVRIPCTREVLEVRGVEFVQLKPTDPSIELKKLMAQAELAPQQYVPLDDFSFVAKVARAQSNDASLGSHLAMFEVDGKDRPFNPKLHEFFRAGYRGPYADLDDERPPWGWVATEASQAIMAEPGTVLDLRLPASPRGEPFVRVNRAGALEVPAWRQMLAVTQVVVRHRTNAEQDIVVPVVAELDWPRIRLRPTDAKWEDFRGVTTSLPNHEPVPYARVADVDFRAEVHGDTRLEPAFAGRRSLVALHEQSEPQGPAAELPYDPHPAELVAMGMRGPVLARDGSALVAARLQDALPGWARAAAWLAALVLAIAAVAAWPELVTEPRGRPIELLVLTACAVAGALSSSHARVIVELSVALAAAAGALVLFGALSQIRAGSRHPGPKGREHHL